MRRKETGGDRRETSYGNTIASVIHQNLSKHLAANKKLNFMFQQQSSTIPMMNPSPTEIVDLFVFVEVTLIQYATVAGHFSG